MKKIFAAMICLLLIPTLSPAAMTCTVGTSMGRPGGPTTIPITLSFDTTPGTATCTLTNADMLQIGGYAYGGPFIVRPGSTGPTDNSDLEIKETISTGVYRYLVTATGNGADVIDNATQSALFGDYGSSNAYVDIFPDRQWVITVTNNAVNNSSCILDLELHGNQ